MPDPASPPSVAPILAPGSVRPPLKGTAARRGAALIPGAQRAAPHPGPPSTPAASGLWPPVTETSPRLSQAKPGRSARPPRPSHARPRARRSAAAGAGARRLGPARLGRAGFSMPICALAYIPPLRRAFRASMHSKGAAACTLVQAPCALPVFFFPAAARAGSTREPATRRLPSPPPCPGRRARGGPEGHAVPAAALNVAGGCAPQRPAAAQSPNAAPPHVLGPRVRGAAGHAVRERRAAPPYSPRLVHTSGLCRCL
jgi:hypothetical protein